MSAKDIEIRGNVMEINDVSSSTARCKTAEDVSAVADLMEVWAAFARTGLLRGSATTAHLPGSNFKEKPQR